MKMLILLTIAIAWAGDYDAKPFWKSLPDGKVYLGMTDYFEGVGKELRVDGSVWGIRAGGKFTAGIVRETLRQDGKNRQMACSWGDLAALIRINPALAGTLADPDCSKLTRKTGSGLLDYRRIGEDWLAVVLYMKEQGAIRELK